MIEHLILDTACVVIAVIGFWVTLMGVPSLKSTMATMLCMFLALTGLVHLAIGLLAFKGQFIIYEIASPLSWFVPATLTPVLFRWLIFPVPRIRVLFSTAVVISVVVTAYLILILKQSYYTTHGLSGRPLEVIPAVLGFAAVVATWGKNCKGKAVSLCLLLFIASHAVMFFSTSMGDDYFIMAHVIKVGWHFAILMLLTHHKPDIHCIHETLDAIERKLERSNV